MKEDEQMQTTYTVAQNVPVAVHEGVLCFAAVFGCSHNSSECGNTSSDDVSAKSSDYMLYRQPQLRRAEHDSSDIDVRRCGIVCYK